MNTMQRILGLVLLAMIGLSGCSSGIQYARYMSKDPTLNLKMDYIKGWLYSEQRGEDNAYVQVLFYEKDLKGKSRRALMAVTANPASGYDSQPVTALSVLYDILNKRAKFRDATILSKGVRASLLGAEARIAEMTYTTLDKLHSADARPIRVREKIIVLRKADTVYTVRYENAAQDFSSFEKAFNRIVKTITLP
jgi:hypothetical protein